MHGLQRREFLRQSGLLVGAWGLTGVRTTWADEPSAAMLVHSQVPHNSEPPLEPLIGSWITPTNWFYVRSHAPVPEINLDTFRLSVEGLVERPLQLTLAELQRDFAQQSVVATLTCAGNRRSEHSLIQPVSGVQWQAGAIGNAEWSGIRLSDVLRKAGVRSAAQHVWFEGVDQVPHDGGIIPFGGSIPLAKALADSDQMPGALIAQRMNGEPLTPDHGFPIRTVVPGYIGARSVKWLGKIVVSDRPSPNHYEAGAYKLVTEDTAEQWSAAPPLETYVMNSVTCVPASGAKVRAGRVAIHGYALSDGLPGRTINKVELSNDGGQHWNPARFRDPARPYCWRRWEAELQVSRSLELLVRATDSAGQVQPATVDWNLKGYMFNAWHKTPLVVSS